MAEPIEPSVRKEIHEAITQARDGPTNDAVLVSAIVVAEWMDPSGDRWISRIATTNGGDETPPSWTCEGLLHHALYGNWTDDDN